jgi:hypothetical protein
MITEIKKPISKSLLTVLAVLLAVVAVLAHYRWDPWGFYRKVSPEETALRMYVVQTAESYLGCNEEDGSYEKIIDLYNAQEVLPVGYVVQYTDSWCATFVSTVAIQCGLTEIIPAECGCERQIGLFQELGRWEEQDSAIPLPGDLIYYDWNMEEKGECTGWADHVGIVVGTKWPYLKVIEGNYRDSVDYHYLKLDDIQIRGFSKPDYAGFLQKKTP